MCVRIHLVLLFSILAALSGIDVHGCLFAQGDPLLKDRFLKEASPAWEKYRARAKRLQGSVERLTIRLSPKKEVMDKDRCEIKQRDGCALFLAQGLGSGTPADEKGLVMCLNSRYGFELRRRTPATPWALVNLDVDLSDGMNYIIGSPPQEAVVYWSACPGDFNLIPSFSWGGIADPRFTVHGVSSLTRNDRQAVRVEFEYRSPSEKPSIPSINKGWVVCDPEHFWVIQEFNAEVEWGRSKSESKIKASTKLAYEYEETPDGFPIVKRVIRRFTPVNGVDREYHYEFDLKEDDVPEGEFTLSAFGLPEPPGISKPFPWYLVTAGIGTACLGIFFFLRSLSKRTGG